jgi:hypothetical protein
MNAMTMMAGATQTLPAAKQSKLPLWLKVSFTGFMAVLVPVYWKHYGPTNFLYFCDVALLLTLAAVWLESSLLASMAAVGILVPQLIWCADFAARLGGFHLLGMTDYMFDGQRPLFLRGLSLFHGWLPFLLLFVVWKLGYNRRALPAWTALAWALMLVAFFFLPPAGAILPNPQTPVNIDYVFGLSDSAPQTWMPKYAWLALMLGALPALFYAPTHFVLKRVAK